MNGCTLISIEGNIGSGKSTLVSILKEHYANSKNIIFLKEPVDEWLEIMDSNRDNIINKFYSNQDKYSFSFQTLAYITRLNLLKKTFAENKNSIIISERSLYTDRYVFAKMLYDTGKMEEINYLIYLKWFDSFISEFSIEKLIYVNTSVDNCFERIGKRNRDGESNIKLDYLIDCDRYHHNMIINKNIFPNQLILDGNINIFDEKDKVINIINNFIFN